MEFLIYSGHFSFLVRSEIPAVVDNISLLYDVSHRVDASKTPFIDFHIAVEKIKRPAFLGSKLAHFLLDDRRVFNTFPFNHATVMLEWGMNWCISTQIQTYLIIHAAVIEKNGFAAVLPAPPGAGKSTLCASLVQEGWRLLSDELTLISLTTAEAIPLPRPIGLKNQSIEIIKKRYPKAVFGLLASDTLKGSVCHLKPPTESVKMQFNSCPIGWIIFPKFEAGAVTELIPKSKGQAFMEIANNAFNYSMLGVEGFEVLKKIVNQSGCFEFKYSNLDQAIAVFDQFGSTA